MDRIRNTAFKKVSKPEYKKEVSCGYRLIWNKHGKIDSMVDSFKVSMIKNNNYDQTNAFPRNGTLLQRI